MKTLLVLRHAKAARDSDSGRDFDRPLAERGRKDARAIGEAMLRQGLIPDLVIASPARRAAETVIALAEGCGEIEPDFEERIYDAPVSRLLEVVREIDDSAERAMVVGHNPGLEGLILGLAFDEPGDDRDCIADGLPTCGLAAIELPCARWRDVSEGTGRIAALIMPRELD